MTYLKPPWKVAVWPGDKLVIVQDREGGYAIAEMYRNNINNIGVTRASAQLMATAPELLEALKLLKNAFIHTNGNVKGNKAKTDIITFNPEVGDALNTAQAAIEKSTQELSIR